MTGDGIANRLRRAAAAGLALIVCAAPAGATHAATVRYSFRGYANNVRVRAPLVGPWQLGVARTRGSGTLTPATAGGTLIGSNNPRYSRYPDSSLRAEVIGYRFYQAAHAVYTKLMLTIEVTGSSDTSRCAIGTRGTLILYDSDRKLENGQNSDYITVHWPARTCLGFVQGWTNENGGARTSPSFGGPPDGGQWAIVNVRIT